MMTSSLSSAGSDALPHPDDQALPHATRNNNNTNLYRRSVSATSAVAAYDSDFPLISV